MSKLVICLVGRKGSGKGTVAKLLKEKYGASVYRFSDVLRDILDRLSVDKTRENLIQMSEVLRHGFGEGVLKQALVKRAEQDRSDLIVLDGLRRLDDLSRLDVLGRVVLVDVAVPLEMRWTRLKERGENVGEATRTLESFKQLELAPTEVTIGDLEKRADIRIDNSGTEVELIKKIDDMMKQL